MASKMLTNFARQIVQNFVNRAPPLVNKVNRVTKQQIQIIQPVVKSSKFTEVCRRLTWRSLASEVRQKHLPKLAGLVFRSGFRPISVFGFVGVTLAGTKFRSEDGNPEFGRHDDICDFIQGIFKSQTFATDVPSSMDPVRVKDFTFGDIIGKGCNAVVYEAKLSCENGESFEEENEERPPEEFLVDDAENSEDSFIILPLDPEIDRAYSTDRNHELNGSEDSFIIIDEDSDEILETTGENEILETTGENEILETTGENEIPETTGENDILEPTGENEILEPTGENEILEPTGENEIPKTYDQFKAGNLETPMVEPGAVSEISDEDDFDLAVKIIFNYEAESSFTDIVTSFQKEALPVQFIDEKLQDLWLNGHRSKMKSLPSHPFIVSMLMMFIDELPLLNRAQYEYPLALPERLNPDGYGRNQTMFLVMKRYESTLREYLFNNEFDLERSIILLTQLVEGVVHLQANNVAHRDLKTNNILIQHNKDDVELVICDFGSCLVEEQMKIPFNSAEICKGGNSALMAPEISRAVPGPRCYLDYNNSDLWTVGSIAYEIFGLHNPFYHNLSSKTYSVDDLPELTDKVPQCVQKVIKLMLEPKPQERISPLQAANMLHIILWGPKTWSTPGARPPTRDDITYWLMIEASKLIMSKSTNQNSVPNRLKHLFMMRTDIIDNTESVYYLQEE